MINITSEIFDFSEISYNQLYSNYTMDLLQPFVNLIDIDLINGIYLNFNIQERLKKSKINPILKLASAEDAQEIVDICNEVYHGTYPYKEFLDVDAVKNKINSINYHWFLFKDPDDNTMGCFKFYLDFRKKRGYLGGFFVKQKYQGRLDAVKAMIGMMVCMISRYKEQIMIWYCENRTAHSKTQYMVLLCGLRPVAFYPNKDIFFNKIESDLMEILFDKRVLKIYRKKTTPVIIPEVEKCFNYVNKRYDLGQIKILSPDFNLDPLKISSIEKNIIRDTKNDIYQNKEIRISIKGSNSYFQFLYTPAVQNFEKTKYKIKNLEELYVFIQEFQRFAEFYNIRYSEVFVSAYDPTHQKIFYDLGFRPRGYVPCWNYNKELKVFEDQILFNNFKGGISPDIKLISEGWDLLEILNLKPP